MEAEGKVDAMANPLGSLDDFPRAALTFEPTPLEPLANLSRHLGGPELFVKRDDCTGLALGGNKARQLEFYFGEAAARRADTVLITGAVQSNYVRMAAAAARKLGMACHIQLEQRVPKQDPLYQSSGNVLLARLLGATLHSYPDGEDEAGADAALQVIAEELRNGGANPYVVPLGPDNPPLGALGYVRAAGEILRQAAERALVFDHVVVASGSAFTHAGLLVGLRVLGSAARVWGICVRRDATRQTPRVTDRCDKIAEMLGIEPAVTDADVKLIDDFLGPGYGQMNSKSREAMRLFAEIEGLLLDPVYTSKTAAGMIHLIETDAIGANEKVLFVHTGGTPALFAYGDSLFEAA